MYSLIKHPLGRVIIFLSFIILSGCAATTYAERPDVKQFIQQMSVQHNFDKRQLTQLFAQVRPNPKIISIMTTPTEGLPWYRYQALFVTPARAQQGALFWQQHAKTLAYAEKRYGVKPEVILAILGVETNYGRTQGTYPVISSLSTLAFDYPPRASYFRGELEQYLLLTRQAPLNPLTTQGSYAGAIGAPQFMPSSYRTYGVDSNGKGYSDLINNDDDIILSVANYFKAHGWQAGDPIAAKAKVTGDHYQGLLQPGTRLTLAQFKKAGVTPSMPVATQDQAALIAMAGQNAPEYWLTFHNFKVIMRYNSSPRYAMAVYQLSNLIRDTYQKQK